MNESQAADALSALSQETRLRILRYLVSKGGAGAPAGDISRAVDAISSRTSFHLSALSRAGLITRERIARSIVYRVDFKAVGGLLGYLVQDCCRGNADVVRCCHTPGDCC